MTYPELWRPLTVVYDVGEARAVVRLVLEEHFGLTMADVLAGQMPDETEWAGIQQRLLKGEPVQYILGWAEFGGRHFTVRPGVLIPRPETYELCQWICLTRGQSPCEVLDIGTGSGCIACTLAAELPQVTVTGWDVSETALSVALENAKRTGVIVSFEQVDILETTTLPAVRWDVIVSNPPYVCEREKAMMDRNVLDYEPHLALFVPDDTPLLFYRAIAQYAAKALRHGGELYFEINPLYAREMEQMLCVMGFVQTETRLDQFGKERFVKTVRQ